MGEPTNDKARTVRTADAGEGSLTAARVVVLVGDTNVAPTSLVVAVLGSSELLALLPLESTCRSITDGDWFLAVFLLALVFAIVPIVNSL